VNFAKITPDIPCFLPHYHQKILDFRIKFPLVLHKIPEFGLATNKRRKGQKDEESRGQKGERAKRTLTGFETLLGF
jgi:hypothetical protein